MTSREYTDIYLPLSERLYRIAYYILESEDDAKDVVQDLFIKLWNSRDTLDSVHNPQAYCITLLRNMAIDRIRKRNIYDGPPPETVCGNDDVHRDIENREKLKMLKDAIGKLPESQRRLLHMKVFDGLSYDEISRETGMNNLTLRVLLSQARRKLKNLL